MLNIGTKYIWGNWPLYSRYTKYMRHEISLIHKKCLVFLTSYFNHWLVKSMPTFAQGTPVKHRAAQQANWQATPVARHTCTCIFLRQQVCVTDLRHHRSVGLLAASSSPVFITTPSVVKADGADRARGEIRILPIPQLRWHGPSPCLNHILLHVLTLPSLSPCFPPYV